MHDEIMRKVRAIELVNAEAKALTEYFKTQASAREYGLSPEACAKVIDKFRANVVYMITEGHSKNDK
jgi:hypothetical protein